MAFTLAEYKKGKNQARLAGVVQAYLNNAPFLNYLPLMKNQTSSITWTREDTLPTAAFRAIGAAYTSSEGTVEEVTESLKIAGGKITADRALLEQEGPERVAISQAMQLKSLARLLSYTFFKGDGTANSFTGLQSRIAAGQTIGNGTAALSLSNLDTAISELEGENKVIYAGQTMYNFFKRAMRDQTVAGNIIYGKNEFGMHEMQYDGIPIVWAGRDTSDSEILDFSEATSTTSLYVVSHERGQGVTGFESRNGLRLYEPKKEDVASEFDVDWNMNYMILAKRSAIRISEITSAAIVQ